MLLKVQKESLRYAFCATGCFANKIIGAAIFEEIKSDYLMLTSFRLHKYKSNLFKALKMGFTSADECAIIEKWKVFRDFCSMMVKSLDKIIKKKV